MMGLKKVQNLVRQIPDTLSLENKLLLFDPPPFASTEAADPTPQLYWAGVTLPRHSR